MLLFYFAVICPVTLLLFLTAYLSSNFCANTPSKLSIYLLTADRLAQLVERRDTVREVSGFEPQTGPTLRVLK